MSLAVEDRIVAMKFDNKQFEQPAKTTMSTLDKLKEKLNFSGSNKGLNDLQKSANRFSLANLGNAATAVGAKFSAMSVAAVTAIATVVHRAVDAGLRIAEAFTIKPLKQGFEEYETQLGSVQTILANTSASGATLTDVNKALNILNKYSDQTIYNFSEMAKNIGTFTAAGVDLDTATASIKGIANLAALSGSNSQQASTAMYQLSQAISSGRVSLQDWNSVVNAGMGGTVFQRALAQTAERMGTLDKGAVKLTGKMKNATINGQSFRESITAKPGEKSWLTSEVLTSTLKQFTGDMTDAELATMGFTQEQIKSIQQQAKTAKDAATQVKTFTQLIGTLQESAGSGWAQTFQILLGDFEEAKKLWTNVNNILGGFISKSAAARNKMLQDWKDLGGRTKLIEGISNIFDALVAVLTPIRQAFRDIFPATTGKQLYNLTVAFLEFTKHLTIGGQTAKDLRRTFAGFFAILSIGVSIIKGVFHILGRLFGFLSEGSGGFLSVTASIGDFLVKLDETIKKGELVNKFFDTLAFFVSVPLAAISALTQAFVEFIGNLDASPLDILSKHFGRLQDRLAPLARAAEFVQQAWGGLVNLFKRIANFLQPAIDAVSDAFDGIWDAIAKAFKAGNFSSVYDALNTGLLTGIVLLIRRFLDKGLKIDFGGGFAQGIRETFGALTDTLTAMQNNIQAKTLLLIAGAIALLTASVVALSLIDSAKLTKALTAMSVAFAQLLAAMAILTKISGTAGFLKVPIIAGAMILLATAVLILSAAVKVLSSMDWEELAKGLTGVAAILAMLVVASAGLSGASGGILRAGLAMVPLAIGIRILASAVKVFSTLSWTDMAKGLTALAGSLLVIAGAMALMPPHMLVQAAALVILSVALNGIGLALQSMGSMSMEEISKGLFALAGALALLAAGLTLMTSALPGAAALLVAAGALAILAPALLVYGKMSWDEIIKGLTLLAGALLVLAAGLSLMTGTAAGAAALLIAAAALAVLAPVLVVLGAMSWSMIVKGLVAIAGAFVVLGLAGLVLTPLVPTLLALGAALLLLGAGFALVGVGALAVATAFSIFAAAGTAGVAVLLAMINLIPQLMIKFAEGVIGFATTLASQADKFVLAFASLLNSMLDAVVLIIPKLGVTIDLLIKTILTLLINNAPLINTAGFNLFLAFLHGLENNIPQITTTMANIMVKMMDALKAKIPELTVAGAELLVALIQGITNNLGSVIAAGGDLVVKYIDGANGNLGKVVAAGGRLIVSYIQGVSANLNKAVTAGGNLIVSFLNGITRQIPRISRAGTTLVVTLIREIGNSSDRLLDAGARLIIRLVNGLARTIRSHSGELRAAGWNLAGAIISGMTGGISDRVGNLANAAANAARRALDAAKWALGISSPSKEFNLVGRYSMEGLAEGLITNSGMAEKAAEGVATDTLNSIRESMNGLSDALAGTVDFDPVIKPVLDLTNITRDAAKIGGMLDQNALSADVSYGQAASISTDQQAVADTEAVDTTAGGNTYLNFEQNNTSPKALSAAELYRNTKNQLAMAKEALGV